MPAASFLTPESQLGNLEGEVGWQSAAEAAVDVAKTSKADKQRGTSFTVETPWLI